VRFFLDNDVDALCRDVLTNAGHDAWTTSEAGRSRASDTSQQDYALDKDAVLITHDREFTRTRAKNRMPGRHVQLCVEQPLGPEVLSAHLDDLLPLLERKRDIVIELYPAQMMIDFLSGGKQQQVRSPRAR
jgi:predicted nuclease of predicted toxin-antitoxin system